MTNFKLGYAALQPYATASANLTPSTSRPLANLFSGSRSNRFEIAAASVTNLVVSYDLGAGVTKSVNFIAIMRAKLLAANFISAVKVYGNSSNSIPGSPLLTATITGSLMGPNDEDYFSVITETTAYRYWWLEFVNTGTASTYPVSNVLFGKALDFGRDPSKSSPPQLDMARNNNYSREATHVVSIKLDAVNDTNKETFLNEVVKYSDIFPVVALDPAQAFLRDMKGLHATLAGHNISTPNLAENDITINLVEQI